MYVQTYGCIVNHVYSYWERRLIKTQSTKLLLLMQKVRQFLSKLSTHGGILYSQKGWFLIIQLQCNKYNKSSYWVWKERYCNIIICVKTIIVTYVNLTNWPECIFHIMPSCIIGIFHFQFTLYKYLQEYLVSPHAKTHTL